MNSIQMILSYINMIGICAIVALGGMVGVFFYFTKVKKVTAKVEKIDNTHFKRVDSLSYVPIKDIIYDGDNVDGDGVIVLSENEFVAGVSVRGFDYPAASTDEKLDAQIKSVAFFNIVENPISFRQSVKSVDLTTNINDYEEIAKKISFELMELNSEFDSTLIKAEDYIGEPDVYDVYSERLKELKRLIVCKKHTLDECQSIIGYLQSMSRDTTNRKDAIGENTNQIMFSYTYNAANYSTELSKEEIYEKAVEELNTQTKSYINALGRCHFRAKRLSARELIGLFRKQTCPITGEDFELTELLDSSYTSLFISSDSVKEAYMNKVGEDAYNQQMEEYEYNLQQLLRDQAVDTQRKEMIMYGNLQGEV